jgi:hypothetical protein
MMRLLLIMLLLTMMLGYQRLTSYSWKIKPSDPTLWIRLCSNIKSVEFKKNDLPSGDEIEDLSSATIYEVLDSIIDDYNSVKHSYVRLAHYPDDPNDPDEPEADDSRFTKSKARKRTIDICIDSDKNPLKGGHAAPKLEDGRLIGCEIIMVNTVKSSMKSFVRTLTHELGHCLGLDHPQETSHAVMSYHASSDIIRLAIDDKIGITHLYPAKGVDLVEKATLGLSCATK